MAVIGVTVLVLAVLGVLTLINSGNKPPIDEPVRRPPPLETGPDTQAAASQAVAQAPKAEVSRPSRPRPADPLGGARWDTEQPGAGAVEHLKFADLAYERADQLEAEDKRFDAAGLRTEALLSYGEVLKREPNQERARDRLGFVRYDPAEAKKLAELQYIPRKLKGCVTEIIETVEQRTANKKVAWPAWFSVKGGPFEDVAGEWRKIYREAKDYEALEAAKATDPFYRRAESIASAIEGDVGPLLKRKKLEGATFDVQPRKPYVILVQRDIDYDSQASADATVEVLQQLRETFLARFRKLNLKPMEEPTPVLVLRYDTDYTKYCTRGEGGPIFSLAHFEPFSKRLVTWKDPDRTDRNDVKGPSVDGLRTVVFHEGTHQLVDYYTTAKDPNWGADQSLWFSEGIADYFGGHSRTWDENAGKWRYEPGLINEERVQQVDGARQGGFLFSLENLLDFRRRDYEKSIEDRAKTATAYAQGWALVYLLSNWNDNKYREKFDEYVKKELAGESGPKAFQEVFGAGAIDTIEKELLEMIDVLAKASKERRIVNGKLIK
jgi:Protein of unknown function (DUF1570)